MARSLAQILKQADEIIEKKSSASAKEATATTTSSTEDDDIFKLAAAVRMAKPSEPVPIKTASEEDFTEMEKMANSLAILETIFSSEELSKLVSMEKIARERGVSEETINKAFETAATKTAAGNKVQRFIEGFGHGLQSSINAFPGVVDGDKLKFTGSLIGNIAPYAAFGTAAAMGGSALKEQKIKKQLGMS